MTKIESSTAANLQLQWMSGGTDGVRGIAALATAFPSKWLLVMMNTLLGFTFELARPIEPRLQSTIDD
ncbi:MAG: hypothetical protein ACSLFE_07815 [Gemmatimonadaceae bacterium]